LSGSSDTAQATVRFETKILGQLLWIPVVPLRAFKSQSLAIEKFEDLPAESWKSFEYAALHCLLGALEGG
jgi:hypothetical protein